jgi:hypothetical protein
MADTPAPRAGGAFLALSIVVCAVIGVLFGQPTIGILAGIAIGIAIVSAIWWRDRPREGILRKSGRDSEITPFAPTACPAARRAIG